MGESVQLTLSPRGGSTRSTTDSGPSAAKSSKLEKRPVRVVRKIVSYSGLCFAVVLFQVREVKDLMADICVDGGGDRLDV
jgi:hypothetical protein